MWGKQEDKNRDLIVNILKTKMELNLNIKIMNMQSKIKLLFFISNKSESSKTGFLIKKAKESNIELSNIEKIKYEA